MFNLFLFISDCLRFPLPSFLEWPVLLAFVPGSDKVAWLLNPPLWCGLYLSLYHSANLLPAIFCAYFFALFDQINRAVQSNTDALVDACMGLGKKMNYLQYSARRRVVSVVLSFARFFFFCLSFSSLLSSCRLDFLIYSLIVRKYYYFGSVAILISLKVVSSDSTRNFKYFLGCFKAATKSSKGIKT